MDVGLPPHKWIVAPRLSEKTGTGNWGALTLGAIVAQCAGLTQCMKDGLQMFS
jgi:hypothetical protein